VAVHDVVVQPRDRELVIGTHGRGIYILDAAPLQEATAMVLAEEAGDVGDTEPLPDTLTVALAPLIAAPPAVYRKVRSGPPCSGHRRPPWPSPESGSA